LKSFRRYNIRKARKYNHSCWKRGDQKENEMIERDFINERKRKKIIQNNKKRKK
jgi:hypothetical protein